MRLNWLHPTRPQAPLTRTQLQTNHTNVFANATMAAML